MEISTSRPSSTLAIATGVFIAQVLAKAAVTYCLPHDPQKPETVASATVITDGSVITDSGRQSSLTRVITDTLADLICT